MYNNCEGYIGMLERRIIQ